MKFKPVVESKKALTAGNDCADDTQKRVGESRRGGCAHHEGEFESPTQALTRMSELTLSSNYIVCQSQHKASTSKNIVAIEFTVLGWGRGACVNNKKRQELRSYGSTAGLMKPTKHGLTLRTEC